MNIREFKKGDNVVRTEASAGCGDRSYMGEKLTFIGIANGCVYFDREEDSFMAKMTGTRRTELRLDWWSEGWEYWQDIDSLENPNGQVKYNLKQEIDKAVANEDYELIAELKDIFESALAKANTVH
jgi:hypothetical protein